MSETTIGRMLAERGIRWGMARPTVACPWPARAQRRRLRGIERRLATLPPGDEAFYEDEVDIHLNPRIGRDWMLPGTQKEVRTPGQNQKHYLAGALHTATGGSSGSATAGRTAICSCCSCAACARPFLERGDCIWSSTITAFTPASWCNTR